MLFPTQTSTHTTHTNYSCFPSTGDLLIPIRYKKNPSLGKFVHNCREQWKLFNGLTKPDYKKKCNLTAERIAELESIGFVWNTQRRARQAQDWEKRFQQLVEYKKEQGDCLVPHGYPPDPSFAEWVHRQRTAYAAMLKGKSTSKAIQDRLEKLKMLDFNFTVHSDKWKEHYEALKQYKKFKGTCQVPTHYKMRGTELRLGRWVHTQRHQKRLQDQGKPSSMTAERLKLLQDVGFSWEVRPAAGPRLTWQQRFDELRLQKLHHGRFDSMEDPGLLGWCLDQRSKLQALDRGSKTVSLGPDRIQLLAAVGFTKDTELPPLVAAHRTNTEPLTDAATEAVTEAAVEEAVTALV